MKPYGFGGIVPMVHQILWSFLLNTVSSLTQYAAFNIAFFLSGWQTVTSTVLTTHCRQACPVQVCLATFLKHPHVFHSVGTKMTKSSMEKSRHRFTENKGLSPTFCYLLHSYGGRGR